MGRLKENIAGADVAVASTRLVTPTSRAELDGVRQMFSEFAKTLKVDLYFQNFDAELRNLSGKYAALRGSLLLATVAGELVDCYATHPLDMVYSSNSCEMKRLYVRTPCTPRPAARPLLAETVLESTRLAGYDCILLDTLNNMEVARALYQELGFEEIPPYYYDPIASDHYLKAEL